MEAGEIPQEPRIEWSRFSEPSGEALRWIFDDERKTDSPTRLSKKFESGRRTVREYLLSLSELASESPDGKLSNKQIEDYLIDKSGMLSSGKRPSREVFFYCIFPVQFIRVAIQRQSQGFKYPSKS